MKPSIITRKEKGEQIIWLSQQTLLSYCDGLSDGYLRRIRSGVKKGEIQLWKHQQIEGAYYYRYDSIPDKNPTKYRSQLPTAQELIAIAHQKESQAPTLLEDAHAYIDANFIKYLPHYNEYNAHQNLALAKACTFLEWSVKYLIENKIDTRPNNIFQDFGKVIDDLEIKYLPSYFRNIKTKILAVYNAETSIAEQIDLPRAGNKNAVAHKEDEELQSWIYQLRSSGANYQNAFIIRKIKTECEKIGKPVPSDRWIGEQMEQWQSKYLTAMWRFGTESKYATRFRTSIPTANALFAGDCWEVDGTRINMIPHEVKTVKIDKNGKEQTVKALQFLYIIAVRDVHSGDVVGMHFDVSEDRWAVAAALRNAVENTGYLPYELRHDRFPGHNTEEMKNLFASLTYLGVKLTCTYKATGKARLERWFGSMQSIALQESYYYYGEGVKSNRPAAHRSDSFLSKMKKVAKASGWDFDKASKEAETKIEKWLNTPYCKWSKKYASVELSPRQMHEQSEKPNIISVAKSTQVYLFGLKKELQIRNNGIIRTEINKELFIYQIEDYNVISRYGNVICCYDVNDLSAVHLYAPSTQALKVYLGFAKEIDPIQQYGPGADTNSGMGKQIALQDYFAQEREQELQRKVANGGFERQNDFAMHTPLTASKQAQEQAETTIVMKQLNYSEDDGAGLNYDPTNDL